jgi:hypothetical protein
MSKRTWPSMATIKRRVEGLNAWAVASVQQGDDDLLAMLRENGVIR